MLADRVASLLKQNGELSAHELADELFGTAIAVSETTAEVEMALVAGHGRFQRDIKNATLWSLARESKHDDGEAGAEAIHGNGQRRSNAAIQAEFSKARDLLPTPYLWQIEALDAWREGSRRGIIEAVTGSGKTMVAILAMLEALEAKSKVQVLVPTIELQNQWYARIRSAMPRHITIGRRGGGFHSTLEKVDVLVSVVNSSRGVDLGAKSDRSDLLIADECHRYGCKINASALAPEFSQRMGLSATIRRDDGGHDKFLEPYFQRTCYSLNYQRALRDGVIANFGVVFIGIALSQEERTAYDWMSDEISSMLGAFLKLTDEGFPDYPALIQALLDAVAGRYSHRDQRIEDIAKALLALMRRRRRMLEFASGKLESLLYLVPEITASRGTVVFTQSIEVAQQASAALISSGIRAAAIDSTTDKEVRAFRIRKFASGDLQAIVSPRILDEGLDFPGADFAVVMAASSSRRQMIQRLGRVLRPKQGAALARFAIFFAQDTVEDPRCGAQSLFRGDIASSAERTAVLPDTNIAEALALLRSMSQSLRAPS